MVVKKIIYKIRINFMDLIRNYFRYGLIGTGLLEDIEKREDICKSIFNADSKETIEKIFFNTYGGNEIYRHIAAGIFSVRNEPRSRNGVYQFMRQEIKSSPKQINKLTWMECDVVSSIFQMCGAFEIGLLFRQIAIKKISDMPCNLGRGIIIKASTYFEKGDFNKTKDILARTTGGRLLRLIQPRYYRAVLNVVEAHCGGINIDDSFSNLINNKDVVLLGPSPVEDAYKRKQDDIIVRFTYKGDTSINERERDLGTDISYYNHFAAGYFFSPKSEKINDLERLKYIVFKGNDGDAKAAGYTVPWRLAGYIQFGITFGGPNMLAVFLYDMKQYRPKSIHIYHLNLWISKQKHEENYMVQNVGRELELKAIVTHDPLGNYFYVKNMYERGSFEADNELKKVLELTPVEYARALSDSFI